MTHLDPRSAPLPLLAATRAAAIAGALAAALAQAACGASPPPTDGPGTGRLDLTGRWASPCVDPGSGQALRLTFRLTAAAWELAYETFADPACATAFFTVGITGRYEVDGPSAAVLGAHEARFGFGTRAVTPASEAAAAFLRSACSGHSFAPGAATDLAGGCAQLGAYPIAACPTDYDLVAREGATLRFGKRPANNDMCAADKRPTELSPIALTRS
jgi:hypothetical protein